ncbi:MAG: response regulator [Bacteroidetes bacterium]|nr:response regulator [Bacteroidota bacterium]
MDIEGNIPDIILLDMNMPRMNGYEFLLEYKKRGYHNRHTKIYMLTTSTLDSDRKKVMETGLVSGYFEKPLTENNVRKIYGDIVVSR